MHAAKDEGGAAMERVYVCECGTRMRVQPEWLGHAGRCKGCGKAVTATIENTEPASAGSPQSAPGSAPAPPPPNRETSTLIPQPNLQVALLYFHLTGCRYRIYVKNPEYFLLSKSP